MNYLQQILNQQQAKTIIIPHIDSKKQGATDHVIAIRDQLIAQHPDALILTPIDNKGGEGNIPEQLQAIKQAFPNANAIVVSGDYCKEGALFKEVLGADTKVLVSSYTFENPFLKSQFEKKEIDYLAIPAHSLMEGVLPEADAALLKANKDRIIEMNGVPHTANQETIAEKVKLWNEATQNLIPPLPDIKAGEKPVMVIIPGDVENPGDKPLHFSEADARKLAGAVWQQSSKNGTINPVFMVTNGPRTGKYKDTENPAFDSHNADLFHNADRMNGTEHNPVSKAFIEALQEHARNAGCEARIIDGCIHKGVVPPQGFLAFYDVLNKHGGELYMDGVSTSMTSEATSLITNQKVKIIACDTPAKTNTHTAAMNDFFIKGYVDKLQLDNGTYSYLQNPQQREQVPSFNDAAIAANNIVSLTKTRSFTTQLANNPMTASMRR